MDFSTFLLTAAQPDFWRGNHKVFCFHGAVYAPLFFSTLSSHVKKIRGLETRSMHSDDLDLVSLLSQLSTSFLGMTQLVCMHDMSGIEAKKKKVVIDYLNHYTGPHHLFFFNDQPLTTSSEYVVNIALPEELNEKMYRQLLLFFSFDTEKSQFFIKKLFQQTKNISLDMACLFLSYQQLVGTGVDAFMQEWTTRLIVPEQSLFTLSQYFFAKDVKAFARSWTHLEKTYSPMFWISFWSEQLWRAYYVIYWYKQNNQTEAKKIAYRLPFSFIQRDWRAITLDELRRAHHYLYELDVNIKHGASDSGLTVFYQNFFQKTYLDS